ncbi:Cys-rich peptide radical SAM maturase CcpM [Paenibacillus sp. 1-18]|uniref:Cys-rich peptide radical SAM maturase CcpM n=1 Tax=Paenibacillus sp. 1-18 TaxID=1333846 RepID=UPI00047258A8|nr:Cys-rich peptide radical SAM maturase CcpM [Paenibacillus sp. 1-18]
MNICQPFIYTFQTRLHHYVYDVNTNLILRIKEEAYHFLNSHSSFDLDQMEAAPELQQYIRDLLDNGFLSSQRPQIVIHPKTKHLEHMLQHQLKTLTLQVTQNCNLRCSYCVYSGGYENRGHTSLMMDFETARKCIDFVIDRSVDSDRLDFGFYGGEPLINFPLIKQCVEYIKEQVVYRDVGFHLTTNGTLLNDDILAFLDEHRFVLTISLDGDQENHDRNRRFAVNGRGSFDTIIANVDKIKRNYPALFEWINFNVVLDTRNDFGCINDFYTNYETFESLYSVRSSYINDAYVKDEILYRNAFIEQRGYEVFKMMLSKFGRVDESHVSKLIKDYYIQLYFRMFHYRKPSAGMPIEAHHGGPCVPGVQRLFADVHGNLFPCERVSEQSEVVQIGKVDTGFEVDKISRILNVGTITEDACKNCWNFRFCTLCVAVADDLHTLSKEKKMSHCSVVKNDIRHTLLDFCMMNELGYDFSEDTILDFEKA